MTDREVTLETMTPPHIHRRLHLTHTVKDGWRCAEVSVSIDCDYDDPINDDIAAIFRNEATMLMNTGKRIATERNRE